MPSNLHVESSRTWTAMRRLTACCCALLCACNGPSGDAGGDQESYFPLDAGSRWVYVTDIVADSLSRRELHKISVIQHHVDNGSRVAVRRSETEGNIGIEYTLRTGPAGIERIAQRMDLEEHPTPDAPPRMVLPVPLKVGASWRSLTASYYILRKSEYPRELKYSHMALMTYTVETLEETVTVPAGTFRHCARISGLAFITLYTDPVSGFRKIPLVTNEWYCKGVGLVKLERVEELATAFFTGGRSVMELREYALR